MPVSPWQKRPRDAHLILEDGSVFPGFGYGAPGEAIAEICFNTAMTGYQEILTDPSYAGQIIAFTFPHIGNVGATVEDLETTTPVVRGLILNTDPTEASNWRAERSLDDWLKSHDLTAVAGIDTRRLTRRLRDDGALRGMVVFPKDGAEPDTAALTERIRAWPGLAGMDLAKEVTTRQTYHWDQTPWRLGAGFGTSETPEYKVVAVDYGAKRNILRMLAGVGCDVTLVPATASAEEILAHQPDGVFLSNGPGDPAATGTYAVPVIQELLNKNLPVFGICLGHQILALALGGKTSKMHHGHRGANHPVQDLQTGKVEITSQNHGFCVEPQSLPATVEITHTSLFDGTNEGLRATDKPAFSVQYHPEASPGPHDSHYLFTRFIDLIETAKQAA